MAWPAAGNRALTPILESARDGMAARGFERVREVEACVSTERAERRDARYAEAPGGERAGLVEDHVGDALERLESARAREQHAAAHQYAACPREDDRGGERERARASDDEDRDGDPRIGRVKPGRRGEHEHDPGEMARDALRCRHEPRLRCKRAFGKPRDPRRAFRPRCA